MRAMIRPSLSGALFLCVALLLLFGAQSGMNLPTPVTVTGGDMPLGELLNQVVTVWPAGTTWLCGLLTLVNGLMLIRIVVRNMIFPERSFLPLILYLVIGSGYYFGNVMLPALIVSLLTIAAFDCMLSSFRRIILLEPLFNAALFTGIALLIWSRAIFYVPLLWVAMLFFKKGGREWIVALAGLLLPLAVCSYVYWGMGFSFLYVFSLLGNRLADGWNISTSFDVFSHPELLVLWGICLTLLILSVIHFWKKALTLRTRPYKAYIYFLWILIFSLVPLLFPSRTATDLILPAAPLSILIPFYLIDHNHWMVYFLYLSLLGSVIFYNLSGWMGL